MVQIAICIGAIPALTLRLKLWQWYGRRIFKTVDAKIGHKSITLYTVLNKNAWKK